MGSSTTLDYQDFCTDLSTKNLKHESVIHISTPAKKQSDFDLISEGSSDDITPVKNLLPTKLRRSLMDWCSDAGAKHPMQMRSRGPKRRFCKPEDYVDYADDLSFLFDDDLPDLECRPRRKARKRRPHLLTKPEDCSVDLFSTSGSDAKSDISESESPRLQSVSEEAISSRKRHNSPACCETKRQKLDNDANARKSQSSRKLQQTLKLNWDLNKSVNLNPKVSLTPIEDDTVTGRRYFTSTLDAFDGQEKCTGKLSRYKLSIAEDEPCGDIEFVDSPDSGFSSETSCSAGTPEAEIVRNLVTQKTNLESRVKEVTRLNLDGESVMRKERLEREKKRMQEEKEIRERYRCLWEGCPNPLQSLSSSELHQHLERYHVENFSCRWSGCKVFGKASRKLSFLQRHISEHSGEKPYKCILDGCDASFSSIAGRKRHVESHYSEVSCPRVRVAGDNSSFSRYLLNSRRIKDKRKTLANRHDCMDVGTLTLIRDALVQNEVSTETRHGSISDVEVVTFRAEVKGRRRNQEGNKEILVEWEPKEMISSEWVLESEFQSVKRVKRNQLPDCARQPLKDILFFGRKSRSRKPGLADSEARPSLLSLEVLYISN